MSISDAIIKLELENKQLKAKLGESMTAVEGFKGKVSQASQFMQKNWVALTASIAAVAVAVRVVTRVVMDWVKAMTEAEKRQALLEETLKLQTGTYKEVAASLAAYADQQQRVTKYGDEEQKAVMVELISMGVRYTDVQKLMAAAADLASEKQISLSTAGNLLARAYNGQIDLLRRYGIFIDSTGNKAEDFNRVLGFVRNNMRGIAEAEGRTIEGRMTIISNKLDEIKEKIGIRLKPVILDAMQWWDHMLGRFEKFLTQGEATVDTQVLGLIKTRDKFNEILLLSKDMNKEVGQLQQVNGQWVVGTGQNVIQWHKLTAQEAVLFKIAQDVNKTKEFELNLQKQIDAIKSRDAKLDADKKAALDAQIAKEEELRRAEELKVNVRNLENQLAGLEPKKRQEWLDKDLANTAYSYDLKRQLLQTYLNNGWILEAEANSRLMALDNQRLEEWKKAHAAQVNVTMQSYQIMSDAFANEFTKNIGETLDKININFDRVFENIYKAFLDMLLQMAAKAAAFGILNWITGGWLGTLTGGLKFNKGGEVPKGYASGGTVSGPSGVDQVPAMLTAGEFVINKAATQMFRPMLEGINNFGRARMATGGPVSNNNSTSLVINAPVTVQGGFGTALSEAKIAKEIGDILKRRGVI